MLNLEVTGYRQEFNHYSWKQISKIFFNQLIFLSLICLRWEIYHIPRDYDHYIYNNQDLKSHAMDVIKWPVDVSCIFESSCTPAEKFGRDYK
jgi:hypothetical protein